MKKILLILLLILTSCGSRKVAIERSSIKKDSVVETKVTVVTLENKEKTDSTNIAITVSTDEIVITPIDTCKDIMVDGKIYKNVILRIKKTKSNTLYTNKKKESQTKLKDSVATIKAVKTEQSESKSKQVHKSASYSWIIWLLLLIFILYVLWRNRRRLLTGL
jgi:ATP-dependent Zn protease